MTTGTADSDLRRGPTGWLGAAGLALAVTAVLLAVVWHELPYRSDDSFWYLQMVQGDASSVPAPFAGRLVHTQLARLLVATGMTADWAFVAVAVPALWICLTGIFLLHRQGGVAPVFSVGVVATWFAAALLRDATLPDVHAAAWLTIFLVAMARRPAWSLPLLAVAVVCRESLGLFALVLAILAWRDGNRARALGALAATTAGLLVVNLLSGSANVHAMGGPLYLAAKFVFNLSRNVAGWELWVPTIDYCDPTATWSLPTWLPTGAIDEVGVCGFNPRRPLWLLVAWSGTFGVVPGWLWAHRTTVRRSWPAAPLWLRASLVYGLVSVLLAPAAGTMLPRLVGYAWPAFWLAAPLLGGSLPPDRRGRLVLAGMHLGAGLMVPLLAAARPLNLPVLAGVACLGICLNIVVAVRTRPLGPVGPTRSTDPT